MVRRCTLFCLATMTLGCLLDSIGVGLEGGASATTSSISSGVRGAAPCAGGGW